MDGSEAFPGAGHSHFGRGWNGRTRWCEIGESCDRIANEMLQCQGQKQTAGKKQAILEELRVYRKEPGDDATNERHSKENEESSDFAGSDLSRMHRSIGPRVVNFARVLHRSTQIA